MSEAYADLEVGIHRWEPGSYAVELSYLRPAGEADIRLLRQGPPLVQFDFNRLRQLGNDAAAYGQALTAALFGDPDLRSGFLQARNDAQTLGVPLRLRLLIGPSAPELHGLRWETLRDPASGDLLVTNQQILFSRYLSSFDFRRVRLRPQSSLRALALVANPSNVTAYQPEGQPLQPVDVAGELALAREGLGEVPMEAVPGRASLKTLSASLSREYDILYLVCHGALVDGKPMLWLERDDGTAHVVSGHELVTRLNELRVHPRLVILVSCQSAGQGQVPVRGNGDALAALGPRLAEAGVPAVLAMQGSVTMQTAGAFMRVFFEELRRDGLIDRAVAAARGQVRDRPDSWMPVLFMRLATGRIWYVPGFAGAGAVDDLWMTLRTSIDLGKCTPILGPGLLEPYLGSSRDLARQLAVKHHFPLAPHDREDLPQVAQYLAITLGEDILQAEVVRQMRTELLGRYGEGLADDLTGGSPVGQLAQLIARAGARRRQQDPAEPHRVLAELPFPIYLTTNPDTLLADALRDAGKSPHLEPCRWREDALGPSERDYEPTRENPLVSQLFGQIDAEDSDPMVLTEDDYFDYLIGVTRNSELISPVVTSALASTALLFLGFRLDDWDFRVLFRSIMRQEGRHRRRRYVHVAVQIDPEEGRIVEPKRARRFLERYFEGANIQIYWGNVEDFTRALRERLPGAAAGPSV
jgi:hypothetical protein